MDNRKDDYMHKNNCLHRARNNKSVLNFYEVNGFGAFSPKLAQGKRITPELVNQWYKEASEKGRNENDK